MIAAGGGARGVVVLVGRPNVGKSTLLNHLVREKIAIVSPVPQTTRNVIEGRWEEGGDRIVFLDTPGIHRPRHLLNRRMVRSALRALRAADLAVVMIDAEAGSGPGDRFVIRETAAVGLPALLLLNKVDRVRKSRLLPLIDEMSRLGTFLEIVPLSARTGENCDRFEEVLRRHLPTGGEPPPPGAPPPPDDRFRIAETIREKVLHATREELPHSAAVLIDRIEERPRATWIHATLMVERESQKKIVIGRQGSKLREIGEAARHDLEGRLGRKVVLKLWVRAVPDWRGDDRMLTRIGLPSGS